MEASGACVRGAASPSEPYATDTAGLAAVAAVAGGASHTAAAAAAPPAADETQSQGDGDQKQEEEDGEEEECAFCAFMKGGGCKAAFLAWEACVEKHKDNEDGFALQCTAATTVLQVRRMHV